MADFSLIDAGMGALKTFHDMTAWMEDTAEEAKRECVPPNRCWGQKQITKGALTTAYMCTVCLFVRKDKFVLFSQGTTVAEVRYVSRQVTAYAAFLWLSEQDWGDVMLGLTCSRTIDSCLVFTAVSSVFPSGIQKNLLVAVTTDNNEQQSGIKVRALDTPSVLQWPRCGMNGVVVMELFRVSDVARLKIRSWLKNSMVWWCWWFSGATYFGLLFSDWCAQVAVCDMSEYLPKGDRGFGHHAHRRLTLVFKQHEVRACKHARMHRLVIVGTWMRKKGSLGLWKSRNIAMVYGAG